MTAGDGAASGVARDGHHPKKGEAAARALISKPDDQRACRCSGGQAESTFGSPQEPWRPAKTVVQAGDVWRTR